MEQERTTTSAYKAAETYDQFFVPAIFRYWTPLLLKRAAPQRNERVLDLACGTGVVARAMVPMVSPQGKVIGLDINPAMLEVACRHYSDYCKDIDWREGQAEAIPFSEQEFDLVTCQQGLQFFKNRPQAAREIHRVLRPGGRVAIEVWQTLERNPFYQKIYGALAAVFNIPLSDLASAYALGDKGELENLLVDAGFRQVKVELVSQDVHFQEVDRFLELTVRSVSAVLPAFAKLAGDAQAELQAQVAQNVAGYMNGFVKEGVLTFPMFANIATGVRPI